MRTAFFMITRQCNKSCPFCFNRESDSPETEMSTADVLRYAESLAPLGLSDLILTGGEPLLARDLEVTLRDLSGRGFRVTVVSNATLLDKKRATKLAASWPGMLVWSLNDFHHREMDRDHLLVELRNRLKKIAATFRGRLSLIFVFTRPTAPLIPSILSLAEDAGVPILVQPAWLSESNPQAARLDPLRMPQADWDRLMATLIPWAQRSGIWRYLDFLEGLRRGGGTRPATCGMGRDAWVVDADGAVSPCFHRRDLTAGNLSADAPDAIASRLNEFRPVLSTADCFGAHCASLFFY